MKNKLLSALFLCCVLFSFSSCSLRIVSVDSLIRAPKLTGVNQQVQQSLDQSVGEDMILKTPLSGEYASAFVYRDLDNDQNNECIAFYALTSSDTVHMNILDTDQNGSWFSVCDTAGSGSDVSSLTFADVDGNGRDEIIVTWQIPESKNNQYLSVYGGYAPDVGIVSMFSELYTAYHALDVNGDGSDEIFLSVIETSGDSYLAYGRLFAYEEQAARIEMVSEIRLDSTVTSYANICHDYEGALCRIYIDGVVSETHMITEVLEVSSSALLLSVATADGQAVSALTLRSGEHLCRDINNDGYVEIPSYAPLAGGSILDRENGVSENLYLTVWNRYSASRLVPAYQYIENIDFGYRFDIPQDWQQRVTAVKDLKLNRLRFYALTENGALGHMLFCIDRTAADADPSSEMLSEEDIIYSDSEYIYRALITDEGEAFGLQITDLIQAFTRI